MTEQKKSGFCERSFSGLRKRFELAVTSSITDSHIIKLPAEHRQPYISYIAFENTNGELLAALLGSEVPKLVSIIHGSACGGKNPEMSLLQEMDIPYSKAMGTLCFGFRAELTERQINELVEKTIEAVSLARSFNR